MTSRNDSQAGADLPRDADPVSGDAGQVASPQAGDLRTLVAQQAEQLESLGAERNSLLSISSALQEEVQQLRHALSEAATDDGVENIVIESVEPEDSGSELERIKQERDALSERLKNREDGDTGLRATVVSLRTELKEHDSAAEEQITTLRRVLEQERQRLAVLQAERSARDAQLEGSRVESSQKDVDLDILRDELEVARQQVKDLQQLVEQGEERVRSLEEDYQDTTRKSHEDLKRKNDIEKEMQGQIERLRKQLEQTSRDFQKSRVSAQEDLDNLRDELHAERQARAEERAQMAARQRELKEQLAAVATEHEVNFSNQSDVIEEAVDAVRKEERSRLQGVLDAHAATEEQLAKVQEELQQAHAEMVMFRHQDRERHQADLKLMEEQFHQAESTIRQLQSQLKELTRERDGALEGQNALQEKINMLRGEVEVARGLMKVAASGKLEDPVRLRKQLDDTRRNVEVAVRLRAEAETARDRLRNERDALLAQLGQDSGAEVPLYIPALDEDSTTRIPGSSPPLTVQERAGLDSQARLAGTQTPVVENTGTDRHFPSWISGLAGLLLVAVIGAAGWWQLRGEQTGPQPAVGDPPVQVSPRPVIPEATPLPDGPPAVRAVPADETAAEPPVMPATGVPAEPRVAPDPAALPSVRSARQAALRTFSDTLRSGGEGPVMVELAVAGYFMGSYGNSLNFEEGPRHLVRVPGFSIGKYEVTFAEYDRFARATGRRLPHDESWGRGERPVINVSWADAQRYVEWLSAQTGHKYRLPSEAEWEYAVRGGSYWMYWWMAAEDAEASDGVWANCHNCGSEWDGASTAPVGRFPANAYGLYDMTGNVQEWVADCYHASYDGAPQDGSAWMSPYCTQRVVRGGGYTSPLDTLRSAKRGQLNQDTRLDNLGFRVVREN
ncbi:MAG: SUMF1/EgtB/PvdO family nonheme iron enzyme [Gammaproteobacteria bacterium]